MLCRLSLAEGIIAFAWEPNGSKFAVLHGESPRINSSFYHVKNNGKIDLISECLLAPACTIDLTTYIQSPVDLY